MIATGRLFKPWINDQYPSDQHPSTYKDAQAEWTRLEIVLEQEAGRDWDRICDVQRRHGDREDGIDSLRARERQQAEDDRDGGDKPNGIDRCLCEAIHAI